jgi:addiction module HigA family antidote
MFIIKRPPTTPGEILKEEFLKPLGLTQKQLADHIGCDVKVVNRIVNNVIRRCK